MLNNRISNSFNLLFLDTKRNVFLQSNFSYCIYATCLSIIIWGIYKYFYPYPNLTFDSYHYLMNMHLDANAAGWPVGYSKLIKYLGFISHSANLLTAIQFFIIQIGFLFFFITIRKIFNPTHYSCIVIFIFLFINPINVFSCNHILSDPLYIGISIIWITQILWIIFRFKPYMIFTQATLLFFLFYLRYNAFYLPLITAFAFIYSKGKAIWKITGIALTILSMECLIQFTSIEMKKISGVKQYAYSNGWKQASNALYIYEHYYKKDSNKLPIQFRELDNLVRAYFEKPHQDVSLLYPDQEITLGSFYMAVGGTPLYSYMQQKSGYTDWSLDYHRTAPYGHLYQAYGNYIIFHHFVGYLKYVVYPHTISYITPYPEIFTENPSAFKLWLDDKYGKIASDFYHLNTLKVSDKLIKIRAKILSPYPFLYTAIHIIFILTLLLFLISKRRIPIINSNKLCLLALIMMSLGNWVFTVLSTTSVLRYQLGIIAIEFSLSVYFIELIILNENKTPQLSNATT